MRLLTDTEIERIQADLYRQGISLSGLDADLLDHLICSTEHYLQEGCPFAEAYQLAFRDLQGEESIASIQLETLQAVREGKSFYQNLLIYGLVLVTLVTGFNIFTQGTNPGLILPAISLVIFFIYHSFFYFRTQKNPVHNRLLFIAITTFPVIGVVLFLAETFPGFRWIGTPGWCLLLTLAGIVQYYYSIRKVLTEPRTTRQLLIQITRFLATSSLLWIPLVSYLKLFKPEVAVFFFLDDLLILSLISFLTMQLLKKASVTKLLLRNRF